MMNGQARGPRIVGRRFNPHPGLTEFSEAVNRRVPSIGPNAPGAPNRAQRLHTIREKAQSYHRLTQAFRDLDALQGPGGADAIPEIFRHG